MITLHRIGQALMALCAVGAVGAFAGAMGPLLDQPPERLWVEAWRCFGFLVFAGLFALLAWRPQQSPLIWELVFLHKLVMASLWFAVPSVAEAAVAGPVDGSLALTSLVAWVLTKGWRSWQFSA